MGPDEEGVEDNTAGSFYLQGEMIHLFAETFSDKAVITATEVVMVELEQDLSQLVLTGYNRVPYDQDILDMTVWVKEPATGGRVTDGTVTLDSGDGPLAVQLMNDDNVFASGTSFDGYSFAANEAGFQIRLHARAFPVNVDSFGQKTVIATLAVEYEAVGNTQSRRRLLTAKREADISQSAEFKMKSWEPTFGDIKGDTVTMALDISFMNSKVSRSNVKGFAQGFEAAMTASLRMEATGRLYEGQVVVEAVYSKGAKIYSRPTAGNLAVNRRRLLASEQDLRIEFTLTKAPVKGAMNAEDMATILDQQLRRPTSPLMAQPLFYGSVLHSCEKIETSDYRMTKVEEHTRNMYDLVKEESSASRALPLAAALLLAAFW